MKKLYTLLMFLLALSSFGQMINIPDARLKAKLLQATTWNATAYDVNGQPLIIDANGNGEIEVSEVQNIDYLSVGSNPTDVQDYISDATGLEMFTSLTLLNISYTNLTTLNLSGLPLLITLQCTQSNLTSVHLSQMPNLKSVSLNYNNLASLSAVDFQGTDHIESLGISNNLLTGTIDLTGFSALKNCGVNSNQIDGLILNGLTQLEEIGIGYTQITSIDLTTLPNFKKLNASHSMLTSLDVSNNPLLTHLYLDFNQITTLDLSHNLVFFYLNIKNNNLTSLFIKNGHNDTIELNNNPSLAYICADESELSNGMLYHNALTQVNSYCSFVPGGSYYEIAGTTRFDFDGNGCDQNDLLIRI